MGAALLIASALVALAAPDDHAPDPSASRARPCTLDRWQLLDEAEQAVVGADFDAGRQAMGELEASLSCGSVVDVELLGRMWLLEGALSVFAGDREAANDAFVAASRVTPGRWIEDLGGRLRSDYEAAIRSPSDEPTRIRLDPGLPPGWTASLNGREAEFPADAPAGLHVVQVGPRADQVLLGRVILTQPGVPSVILVDPDALTPPPAPAVVDDTPAPRAPDWDERRGRRGPRTLAPWLAAGTLGALGKPLVTRSGSEPGVKVVLPLEAGLVANLSPQAWARAAVSAAPLLGGRFLWSDGDEVRGSALGLGGHLAGGLRAGQVEPGVLAGVSWPGRITLHGLLGIVPSDAPVRVELRLGAHLATEREPEPAAGLSLSLPVR